MQIKVLEWPRDFNEVTRLREENGFPFWGEAVQNAIGAASFDENNRILGALFFYYRPSLPKGMQFSAISHNGKWLNRTLLKTAFDEAFSREDILYTHTRLEPDADDLADKLERLGFEYMGLSTDGKKFYILSKTMYQNQKWSK